MLNKNKILLALIISFSQVMLTQTLFCQGKENHPFPIVKKEKATSIVIDNDEAKVVFKAANLFRGDVFDITEIEPQIKNVLPPEDSHIIIAGTIETSNFVDDMVKSGKINVDNINNKWESWKIQVVNKPFKGIDRALVVIGSDRRATAYGILELSRMMGVSPWKWWADVTPMKQNDVILNIENKTYHSPSVKYRGLFINDEDWGLQPWAAKTFEPETGDIGPKTYAKVFDLMLRLRANSIWPAMHSCTKAFFTIPGNAQTADDYAIVVGTSHCEPMLCNINAEWNSNTMGEWRYDNNSQTIKNLFESRTKQTANFESIYTIGMRGKHDSPMNVKNMTQNDQIKLLETVIDDQRNILENEKKEKAENIPQVFIPYKEVLTYYQNGLKVPDDVTLMWTDDNYGYIRQLSNSAEQKRSGGAGIYYHASYWGRPHDYLWLSSTNPVLIWEEMTKAYATNARNMWILNCGDIKPLEYNIEFFMDLAWNIDQFPTGQSVTDHMHDWFAELFGNKKAKQLTSIMSQYSQLNFIRRPEFMAWSQTEPTTKPEMTEMTQIRYGDEVSQRIAEWETLAKQVQKLYNEIPDNEKDAFYELVYYPVTGASLLNQKWLYHYKNQHCADQNRSSANLYADLANKAYQKIQDITTYYNQKLQNGKWNHIMSMNPRGLPVFSKPTSTSPSTDTKSSFGIAVEGYEMEVNHTIPNAYSDVLPVFNAYLKDSCFIDIFLKGNEELNWQALPKDSWIHLSYSEGRLDSDHPEQRIWVKIDWDKVPKGENKKEAPLGHDYQVIPPSYKVNSAIDFICNNSTTSIGTSVYNPEFPDLKNYKGFIEGNGFVSINAENYSSKKASSNVNWEEINGLGYTGNVMTTKKYNMSPITDTKNITEKSPALTYDFYTFNFGAANVIVQAIPSHPTNDSVNVRCAVAIDDATPVIIDFSTHGRSEEWKQNVLKNAARKSAKQIIVKPGKHTLKIWMVDPGVMIDQILIDLGGWKESYAFPKETKMQ